MSMICPKCGTKLDDGVLFCTECGAFLAANANAAAVKDTAEKAVNELDAMLDQAKAGLDAGAAQLNDIPTPTLTLNPGAPFDAAAMPEAKPAAAATAPAPAAPVTVAEDPKAAAKEAKARAAAQKAAEKEAAKKARAAEKAAKKAASAAPAAAAPAAGAKPLSTAGYFFLMLLFAIPVLGWLIAIVVALAAKNPNLKSFARATLTWLLIGLILLILAAIAVLLFSQKLLTAYNAAAGTSYASFVELFGSDIASVFGKIAVMFGLH